MKRLTLLLGICIYLQNWGFSQKFTGYPDSLVVYKTIDTVDLTLTIYYPPDYKKGKKYPAMVFFFGGGWKGGTISQFRPHAHHFANRGMITLLADYRVESRHGTTPFDAVMDAKSAMRFIRQHRKQLGIKTNRIAAAGGSAGGHLAAATATLTGLEEPGEKLSISSRPNALVLFNPVFDNGPDGYGFDRVGGEERYREISPLHNIRPGTPPTIVFLGTNDRLIPVSTAENYQNRMKQYNNRCDLHLFEGQNHGFFNYKYPEYYQKTVQLADDFLVSLGWIKPQNPR